MTYGIVISKAANGSQLICGQGFVGNLNSVVTTQNSQALSSQAKGHFPSCQDTTLKARGPLQPAQLTGPLEPAGRRRDECGGKWSFSPHRFKAAFYYFLHRMQLDKEDAVTKCKKETKKSSSVHSNIYVGTPLPAKCHDEERSIAIIWKPKSYLLTSAYVGLHVVAVNLTHGTRG